MPRVVEYFGQSLKAALSRRINRSMVTFANLGSVHLPSLKFVGLCVRKIWCIQCVSCLSTTVSQLFEPQLQKNRHFTYPGLHFCLPWGRPCDNHAKRCMNEKKNNSMLVKPLAACTHLSSTVSQLFEPQVQKIAVFTYRSPHFCFPWRRPCDYHAICYMDGKTIQCLPKNYKKMLLFNSTLTLFCNFCSFRCVMRR